MKLGAELRRSLKVRLTAKVSEGHVGLMLGSDTLSCELPAVCLGVREEIHERWPCTGPNDTRTMLCSAAFGLMTW